MMEMLLEVKRETKNTNEAIKRIESSSKNRNLVVLKVQLNIVYIRKHLLQLMVRFIDNMHVALLLVIEG